MEDLQYDWRQMNLELDGCLAFTPEDRLVGYSAVIPRADDLRFDVYIDPTWEGDDLAEGLLSHCEARADTIVHASEGYSEIVATAYTASNNPRDQDLFISAGFNFVKHHFQMQIELATPHPAPEWPKGVSVRTAIPGEDDRQIHSLIQTAYDWSERDEHPFEDWQNFMMRPEIFDPKLWFLSVFEREIIGVCLSLTYPDLGWVRQLGVLQHWRRKGLGRALLMHAFSEFYRRGFRKAGLAVESENPGALAFYEKIGLQPLRQYNEYQKVYSAKTTCQGVDNNEIP
jgi:GNAT superfamily N-acetyltransferase